MLLFHGLAMNGGLLHPFECLQPRELAAAKSGYRFFGFHDVADLISDIGLALTLPVVSDLQEPSFGHRYSKSVPDDSALANRFEEYSFLESLTQSADRAELLGKPGLTSRNDLEFGH